MIRSLYRILTIGTVLVLLFTSSCNYASRVKPIQTPSPFEALKRSLDEIAAGRVLGSITVIDGKRFLITDNYVLSDGGPKAGYQQQVYPVGRELVTYPSSGLIPYEQPDGAEIFELNDIRIWNALIEIVKQYQHLTGSPLTPPVYNDVRKRYEQYFENLAFYQDDADGEIYLISYGRMWMMGESPTRLGLPGIPDEITLFVAEKNLLAFAKRLGEDFTGLKLSGTRIMKDGTYEIIFENVVMYLDPTMPTTPQLRELSLILGGSSHPFEGRLLTKNGLAVTFFDRENGRGYNMLTGIYDYIRDHSGLELSGPPIGSSRVHESKFTQCLRAYCVEMMEDSYHPGKYIYKLLPLGREYEKRENERIAAEATLMPAKVDKDKVSIMPVFIQKDMSASGYIEVEASIFENNIPLPGLNLYTSVFMPGGIEKRYLMPPTDMYGKTRVELSSLVAENGTYLQYEVCLTDKLEEIVCSKWGAQYQK